MQCLLGMWKTLNAQYFRFLGEKLKWVCGLLVRIVFQNVKCRIPQQAALLEGRMHFGLQGHPYFSCKAWCFVKTLCPHLGCTCTAALRLGSTVSLWSSMSPGIWSNLSFLVESEMKTPSDKCCTPSQGKKGFPVRWDGSGSLRLLDNRMGSKTERSFPFLF